MAAQIFVEILVLSFEVLFQYVKRVLLAVLMKSLELLFRLVTGNGADFNLVLELLSAFLLCRRCWRQYKTAPWLDEVVVFPK
jgi:hypothetical protein